MATTGGNFVAAAAGTGCPAERRIGLPTMMERRAVHQGSFQRTRSPFRLVGMVCALCLGVAIVGASGPGSGQAQTASTRVRIGVVKSLDLPQYNSAYEGFIATLRSTGYEPEPVPITLSEDHDKMSAEILSLCNSKPDLILTLGTRAAREVSMREKSIPIVYSMVLTPPEDPKSPPPLPEQSNLVGASLNIPLDVQFKYVTSVFPTAARVGIISNPGRSSAVADSARLVAEAHGMKVRVQWVKDETEVPNAVRAIIDSIDVFLMIPDETVFTPQSSRYIIFELIKAGVPIMGLSSAYVRAGAVMALDCDYTDIGRQSGELAVRILAGQSPATLNGTAPRVFTLALNANVREHLRIDMAKDVFDHPNVTLY